MSDDDYKRVGPIVAERDDDEGLTPGVVPDGRTSSSRKKADFRSPQPEPGGARGAGRGVTIILLVAVIALSAYCVYLGQQHLETHTALENLQARFDHLEEQILTTDESLSESGAAIQGKLRDVDSKLREVDSEIRKLWGVSNDRNRKAIAANSDAVATLQGALGKLEQTQSSQVGALNSLRTTVEGFDRKIGATNAEVLAAMAEIEQIKGRLNAMNTAADRIEAIANRANTLENRVRSHEEAIQSIDAFRRQTNQSLLQLRQQTGAP